MKKIMSLAAAMLAVNLMAGEEQAPTPADQYTIFQVGIVLDQPSSVVKSNVYGVKAGLPITNGQGRVCGIEASFFYSGTAYIRGAQGSWILNNCKTMQGIQGSWIGNLNSESFEGIQAALAFDVAGKFTGLQAAGVTVSKDFLGLQASALASVSKNFDGFQTSVGVGYADGNLSGVQFCGLISVTRGALTGFQTSVAFNKVKSCTGLQFGLINVADDTSVQFGLINVIKNGPVPFMPFVNLNW